MIKCFDLDGYPQGDNRAFICHTGISIHELQSAINLKYSTTNIQMSVEDAAGDLVTLDSDYLLKESIKLAMF